jgi:hypothetical protein
MNTSLIHIPASTDEFRPPKPTDLITEAANMIRAHWEEIRPYFQMFAGEVPSKHGSLAFDEAECAFQIKDIAAKNGFAVLSNVTTAVLWKALRRGYYRNTGVAVRAIEAQNKRLRLEHKHDAAE